MITAKEFLNKIRWDDRENPEEYNILYIERMENKLRKCCFSEIKRIDGNFMILKGDGVKDSTEEREIPIHRIREIRKREDVVWKRR